MDDLTGQVPAGRRIPISYQNFLALTSHFHCVFDNQGRFVFASAASFGLLGYQPEELTGKPLSDFLHARNQADQQQETPTFSRLGEPVETQNHYLRKDGHLVQLHWSSRYVEQEQRTYAVARPCSPPDTAVLSFQTTEARYRALLDNGYDMVNIVTAEGEYTFVSESVTRILGHRQEDLLGKNGFAYIHPDDLPRVLAFFQSQLHGDQTPSAPFRFRAADGSWRWLETTVTNQLQNPAIQGVVLKSRDMTDQILAEQCRHAEKQRYESLFKYHPDAVFSLNREGYIQEVNHMGCQLLRQPEEKILQKHFTRFLHARQLEHCLNLFKISITGTAQYLDTVYLTKSEVRVDVSLTLIPIHVDGQIEGVYTIVRDVSEIKKNERELQKLSQVASKVKNVILVTDKHGKIEWANEAFTHESGYTLEEVQGKWPAEVLSGPETEMQAHRRIAEKVNIKKEMAREELLRYNKDGSLTWIHLELTPILDEQGDLQRVVSVTTDITEIKTAQQENLRLTEDLLRQNRDLHQFGYIVSHNLRSPVANILGLVYLLSQSAANPTASEKVIKNLQGAAQHLDTVIRDLNQILTVRQEIVELKEEINLATEVENILNSIHQQLEACGATATVNLTGGQHIFAVRSYVTSILQNLLTNAIRYRSPDRKPEIQIYTETEGEFLCLSVKDNGLGIDLPKEKDNIFKLYKRFHFHIQGKGLGLHLVKTQVEAMGGKITVESVLREGTTFKVWFKQA
ncbi:MULTISPECIES: PAS domain S-box protein [Rufibacter]|uniref:histidine kinase n=1 Tax=Rufibacter quisquiliarum TaxID=1549639 RepID=A0A839GX24_9BACT|nr:MULTISPECIES: PAS domain S-box protein [Rufibacter]MBA9078978.1 PAS domain S-box-containing protein [Rufibacter quisquiliarum]